MTEYTYLRFTGTGVGSHNYQAQGIRKMAFGQNPSHFQQLVTREQADALKAAYPKELLEVPLEFGRAQMQLHTLISASNVIPDSVKVQLGGGYLTLGEVLADQDNIYAIFGDYEAPRVLNAIRKHFGLPLLPQPEEVVAEEVVEQPVKKSKKKDE